MLILLRRAHAGYRQGQVPRQEAWDARGGGYGDRPQSSSGRPHDGGGRPYEGGGRPYDGGGRYPSQQPPVPANAYPGGMSTGWDPVHLTTDMVLEVDHVGITVQGGQHMINVGRQDNLRACLRYGTIVQPSAPCLTVHSFFRIALVL